jgi:hypothetical protein
VWWSCGVTASARPFMRARHFHVLRLLDVLDSLAVASRTFN